MLDSLPIKGTVDATLDYAKDYDDFSTKMLTWAIECRFSTLCIGRCLRKQLAYTLEYELGVALKNKPGGSSYPLLFFAVEQQFPGTRQDTL